VGIPDIDIEILSDYGYTYETYLAEAEQLAEFIKAAVADGFDIICQCDYGQSRSAACAAAILQYYEGRGIDIFADYRYYPNQLVYHKVFDALNT
jgi:protein-tyrosine phosphatase